MKKMLHAHRISFKNAYAGMKWAFFTQPNYRIHFLLSIISIGAGIFYSISNFEWLTIFMLITIGLVIETVNTALECTNDAITTKIKPEIKIAKDVAAGAMLIFAIGAASIAFIIFFPKI